MRTYASAGVSIPAVLLPKPGVDMSHWAVVACDQYTSEPAYWQGVQNLAGDAPSTLHLIYPEVYLNESDPEKRIASIRASMAQYLHQGVLESHEGMVYVERQVERVGNLHRPGTV